MQGLAYYKQLLCKGRLDSVQMLTAEKANQKTGRIERHLLGVDWPEESDDWSDRQKEWAVSAIVQIIQKITEIPVKGKYSFLKNKQLL